MRELAGFELSDASAWEDAAKVLVQSGKVGMIALTMGHLGAVLVTREHGLRASSLAIAPTSAVGAGDSFLGGLIYQLASGAGRDESFRQAVAAGAAALLNPGTELCLPHDIKRLAEQVILTTVS
jgi:6-phosphofructokinase 2